MGKGNQRPGWGQPGAMDQYSVCLTARHARKARRLLGTELADGVRYAIEIAPEPQSEKSLEMVFLPKENSLLCVRSRLDRTGAVLGEVIAVLGINTFANERDIKNLTDPELMQLINLGIGQIIM